MNIIVLWMICNLQLTEENRMASRMVWLAGWWLVPNVQERPIQFGSHVSRSIACDGFFWSNVFFTLLAMRLLLFSTLHQLPGLSDGDKATSTKHIRCALALAVSYCIVVCRFVCAHINWRRLWNLSAQTSLCSNVLWCKTAVSPQCFLSKKKQKKNRVFVDLKARGIRFIKNKTVSNSTDFCKEKL